MGPFHWYATCQGIGLALGVSGEIWESWAGQWWNGDCRSGERRQKTKKKIPVCLRGGRVTSEQLVAVLLWCEVSVCVCVWAVSAAVLPLFHQLEPGASVRLMRVPVPWQFSWQDESVCFSTARVALTATSLCHSIRLCFPLQHRCQRTCVCICCSWLCEALLESKHLTFNLRNFNEEGLVCNFTNEISFLQVSKVQQQTAERQRATECLLIQLCE